MTSKSRSGRVRAGESSAMLANFCKKASGSCPFEAGVFEAVWMSRWPDQCEPALRAHVAGCAVCADIVLVAEAFEGERTTAWREAPVPGSGRMWWRAQMRARQEAARAAARPITLAQGVAVSSVFVATLVLAGALSPWFRSWLGWLGGLVPVIDLQAASPWMLFTGGTVLLVLIGAPVALYAAFKGE